MNDQAKTPGAGRTRKRRPEGERRKAPTVAGKSIYTAPVSFFEEPEIKGRLTAWADALGVASSVLAREALRAGMLARVAEWRRIAGGELDEEFLAQHVAKARGASQPAGPMVAVPDQRAE